MNTKILLTTIIFMLLLMPSASAWWDGSYSFRQQINLTNSESYEITTIYTARIELDTATMVSEGKALASGNDIKIIYDTGTPLELDRINATNFNNANTKIDFNLQANISSGGSDGNYWVYYGNPSASSPPENRSNIYFFYEDFTVTHAFDFTYKPFGDLTPELTQYLTDGGYIEMDTNTYSSSTTKREFYFYNLSQAISIYDINFFVDTRNIQYSGTSIYGDSLSVQVGNITTPASEGGTADSIPLAYGENDDNGGDCSNGNLNDGITSMRQIVLSMGEDGTNVCYYEEASSPSGNRTHNITFSGGTTGQPYIWGYGVSGSWTNSFNNESLNPFYTTKTAEFIIFGSRFGANNIREQIHELILWKKAQGLTESFGSEENQGGILINIVSPTNTTYWGSVFVNVTAENQGGGSYFCEVFDETALLVNVTNMTSYEATIQKTTIGGKYINATCNQGGNITNTVRYYSIDDWAFWVRDENTGTYLSSFSLNFDNGTDTYFESTTNYNVTVVPINLPQGLNDVTITSSGYGTENFSVTINATQNANITFELEPSGLSIYFFDELTGGAMPNPVLYTISNSTLTFTDTLLNKYDQVIGAGGSDFNPQFACDRTTSSALSREGASMDIYCYIGIYEESKNNNYSIEFWGFDAQHYIEVFFYNTLLDQYDLIHTTATGTSAWVKETFVLNNSDGNYNGYIYSRTFSADQTGGFENTYLREIYLTEGIVSAGYEPSEIPQGSPSIVQVNDIPVLNDYTSRDYFITINNNTRTTLNSYLLETTEGLTQPFSVLNVFQQGVVGATITARRDFGNGYVTVAQAQTDSTGLATIFLSPEYTYSIIVERTGFTTITTTIKPTGSVVLLTFPTTVETNFTEIFDDITYLFEPLITGLGTDEGNVNFSFTINSVDGELSSIKMNITAPNGTEIFTSTVTGSPNGATITSEINITVLNGTLLVQGTFISTEHGTETINREYRIYLVNATGYTLNELINTNFESEYGISDFQKQFIGIFIIAIIMGGVATLGVGIEIAGLVGIIALVILGMFGVFSWGLVIVISLTILSIMYLKWRV